MRRRLTILVGISSIALLWPVLAAGGPASKMKIVYFSPAKEGSLLKLQFLDEAGKPTKALPGGRIGYRTSITQPRAGGAPMTAGRWDARAELYVFSLPTKLTQHICPPRVYWIRVTFRAGRKRFRAFRKNKFPCR